MERIKLTQVISPEEFLIGKTVISTGKHEGYMGGPLIIISFVFSDNTYVLFRVDGKNLLFSNDESIVSDVEQWAIEQQERLNFMAEEKNNAELNKNDPEFRKQHAYTIAIPDKYRYAKMIFDLKLITEEVLKKYEIENELFFLKDEIKGYETWQKEKYDKNILRLKELESLKNNLT